VVVLNKRGISPLLATVLLIAFAIALGALVLNYGENFVMETSAEPMVGAECPYGCQPVEMAAAGATLPESGFVNNIAT
jgi:flagellin-like protein